MAFWVGFNTKSDNTAPVALAPTAHYSLAYFADRGTDVCGSRCLNGSESEQLSWSDSASGQSGLGSDPLPTTITAGR